VRLGEEQSVAGACRRRGVDDGRGREDEDRVREGASRLRVGVLDHGRDRGGGEAAECDQRGGNRGLVGLSAARTVSGR
jgi:hypothetical protein